MLKKNLFTIGLAALGLAIASIDPAEAAQADSGMPKKSAKVTDVTNHRYFAVPKEIQLTSEQKLALDEIKQKQAPKLSELLSQMRNLLTKDQKAARKAAIAKARMDGVKGKARTSAIDQALNLTDEQKKQMNELKPGLAKLRLEIKQQIYGLLTEEQRTHFKLPKPDKTSALGASKAAMPNS